LKEEEERDEKMVKIRKYRIIQWKEEFEDFGEIGTNDLINLYYSTPRRQDKTARFAKISMIFQLL